MQWRPDASNRLVGGQNFVVPFEQLQSARLYVVLQFPYYGTFVEIGDIDLFCLIVSKLE